MRQHTRRARPPKAFPLLLGGLAASFVGATTFSALMGSAGGPGEHAPLIAALVGTACALGFMVGGVYAADRVPWLASALIFGSGFTTLWTLPLWLGSEPRWAAPIALGLVGAIAATLGLRRFGHKRYASASVQAGGLAADPVLGGPASAGQS